MAATPAVEAPTAAAVSVDDTTAAAQVPSLEEGMTEVPPMGNEVARDRDVTEGAAQQTTLAGLIDPHTDALPTTTATMLSTEHSQPPRSQTQYPALPPNTTPSDLSPPSQPHQPDPSQSSPLTTAPLPTTLPAVPTSPPNPRRKPSEALGPGAATDLPISALPVPPTSSTTGPTLSITLMLTTGARHPYKIDEKYLRSRKVELKSLNPSSAEEGGEGNKEGGASAIDFDPREISGYKLKELIWTDWRSEWEARPVSPSSIRLILLGRLVEDKVALKDYPFKLNDMNVVHMTIKPADFEDDADLSGGKKGHSIRGVEGEERRGGLCRCVIL